MRTCFLHIGTNKTGTTTIQRAFHGFENEQLFCPDLGAPNQSLILVNSFIAEPERYRLNQKLGYSGPKLQALCESARHDLQTAAQRNDKNMLLSGEGMSNIFNRDEIEAMVRWLRRFFDCVVAVCYMREPQSFLRGLLQQRLRGNGQTIGDPGLQPKYQIRVGGWISVLGRDQVSLSQFHPDRFESRNLLTDFSGRIGVEPPVLSASAHKSNASLSAEAFSVLYAYRRMKRTGFRNLQDSQKNNELVGQLLGFGNAPIELHPDFSDALLSECWDDIAWAEDQLGEKFLEFETNKSAVCFESEQNIIDYAATQAATFDTWQAQVAARRGARIDALAEMVDTLYKLA